MQHNHTAVLQVNAYHIVITRFIFGLGILCKQAFGVRSAFPCCLMFERSETLHVYTSAVAHLNAGCSLRQSLPIALHLEAVFCGELEAQ